MVTREQLIEDVWDMNWFGSTKTLDVHVSGLRRKLGDDPAEPRYLHTVRGVGLPVLGALGDRLSRRMSLRVTLLGRFAYALLVVLIALALPLILNLSKRVDAEVEAESAARSRSSRPTAADDLDQPGRACARSSIARRGRSAGA